MLQQLTVKNKRLKMSPGGLITLPVSARKSLQMEPGKAANVYVSVDGNSIVISRASNNNKNLYRVSPKGMLELTPEAKNILSKADKRHYWLDCNDPNQTVVLHPY